MTDGGGPIFEQIARLEQRRRQLQLESTTPADFTPITKAELEELRHMARPPDNVRRCLEVVYAVLHVGAMSAELGRSRCPQIKWPAVQAMLARFDSFFPAMASYDVGPLIASPELTAYLSRTYFDADAGGLTEAAVRRSSQACSSLFRWCGSSLARVHAALELAAINAQLLALAPAAPEAAAVQFWDAAASHAELQISADGSRVASENSGYASGVRAVLGGPLLARGLSTVTFLYESGHAAYMVVGVCAVDDPDFLDADGRPLNAWERAYESTHKGCWQYSFFYNLFSADGERWARSQDMPDELGQPVVPGDEVDMELSLPPGTLSFYCRKSRSRGNPDRRLLGAMQGLSGEFRAIALLGMQGQSLRVVRFEQE